MLDQRYLLILRRTWPLVAGLPLIVAALSIVGILLQPLVYESKAEILVSRGPLPFTSTAGLTDQGEDKTPLDVPAIISSIQFRQDLSQAMAERGFPTTTENLLISVSGEYDQNKVTLETSDERRDATVAKIDATIALLQANGLRYWGETRVTAGNSGLNILLLIPPSTPVPARTLRDLALEIGARTVAALFAGVVLVFLLHYLAERRREAVAIASADQTASVADPRH